MEGSSRCNVNFSWCQNIYRSCAPDCVCLYNVCTVMNTPMCVYNVSQMVKKSVEDVINMDIKNEIFNAKRRNSNGAT